MGFLGARQFSTGPDRVVAITFADPDFQYIDIGWDDTIWPHARPDQHIELSCDCLGLFPRFSFIRFGLPKKPLWKTDCFCDLFHAAWSMAVRMDLGFKHTETVSCRLDLFFLGLSICIFSAPSACHHGNMLARIA